MIGRRLRLSLCLSLFVLPLHAESKNPADYPLRIHIFGRNQTTFYTRRMMDEAKGDGRANLFENGAVRGVDFTYDCAEKLRTSMGYETYPAKWKKQDRELTVLMPEFGKTNAYWTCTLKTGLKDDTYVMHSGSLGTESVADFKNWMVKHDYDPEHGKDTPVRTESPGAPAPGAVPTPPAPAQPQ